MAHWGNCFDHVDRFDFHTDLISPQSSCFFTTTSCLMPDHHCHCRGCGGKSVSRSTYYAHAKRRVQENAAELQALIIPPEEPPEEDGGNINIAGPGADVG